MRYYHSSTYPSLFVGAGFVPHFKKILAGKHSFSSLPKVADCWLEVCKEQSGIILLTNDKGDFARKAALRTVPLVGTQQPSLLCSTKVSDLLWVKEQGQERLGLFPLCSMQDLSTLLLTSTFANRAWNDCPTPALDDWDCFSEFVQICRSKIMVAPLSPARKLLQGIWFIRWI